MVWGGYLTYIGYPVQSLRKALRLPLCWTMRRGEEALSAVLIVFFYYVISHW